MIFVHQGKINSLPHTNSFFPFLMLLPPFQQWCTFKTMIKTYTMPSFLKYIKREMTLPRPETKATKEKKNLHQRDQAWP